MSKERAKSKNVIIVLLSVLLLGIVLVSLFFLLQYPTKHKDIIKKYSEMYCVPSSMIASVIKVESGYDSNAVSSAGAVGLMQILPATAFDMADIFIGNLPKAETEIYALYADMAGITVEQIKEMEFGTLPLMIYDSFHGVKNTSFFKVLSRLL